MQSFSCIINIITYFIDIKVFVTKLGALSQ